MSTSAGQELLIVVDLFAGALILSWPDLGLAILAVIMGVLRCAKSIATGWQLPALDRAVKRSSGAPAVA